MGPDVGIAMAVLQCQMVVAFGYHARAVASGTEAVVQRRLLFVTRASSAQTMASA